MRACVAVVLMTFGAASFAQAPAAYPEPEATAAWRGLAASYVRKAVNERKLDTDPVLNARVDAVMAAVGAAVAAIDARFSMASWRAILIEDFGRGATAFPGQTILVDSRFVRSLELTDDELALVLSHEAAHVLGGHATEKLSFMAEVLGKEKLPTARTALLEFLARDRYAEEFQPKARMQEREADSLGAAILFATGFDLQQALKLFDKLAVIESRGNGTGAASHDAASLRKLAVAKVISELQEVDSRSARRNLQP